MKRFNCTECGELVVDTRRQGNELCTACEADQLGCDPVSVDVVILRDFMTAIEPHVDAECRKAFGVKGGT